MSKDTESYPPVCIGWDLASPSCGDPQDCRTGGNRRTPWATDPVDRLTRCGEYIKVNTVTYDLSNEAIFQIFNLQVGLK